VERIADTRRSVMQLRRVMAGARYAVFQLRHASNPIITADLAPFLRDVHDDLTIQLETIAGERDQIRGLIRQLAEENPDWGAPKIHGDRLGSVSKLMSHLRDRSL
jgi:Mg2+ and Co2+ transporter CorA